MYEAARKRQNLIALGIVLALAVLLFVGYSLIAAYADGSMIGVAGTFVALTGVAYVGIRAVVRHTEAVMIHALVARGKISLARIERVAPLREVRDFCFGKHRLYTFDLTVFDGEGDECARTIVEDIVPGAERPASGTFVYVTDDGDLEHMGIVPTLNIYVTPALKERVRAYEERYHPRYMEVLRSNGLIFRPFASKGALARPAAANPAGAHPDAPKA